MDVNFRDRFLALQRLEMAERELACETQHVTRPASMERSKRRTTTVVCKTRRSRRPATALGVGAGA
jgi:hypothetical protein